MPGQLENKPLQLSVIGYRLDFQLRGAHGVWQSQNIAKIY